MNPRWTAWQALSLVAILLGVGLAFATSSAEPEACRKLPAPKRTQAMALLGSLHPYECCDRSIAACLQKKPCSLVKRLANDVCSRVAKGEDKATIERALNRRGALALPTAKQHTIGLKGVELAGDGSSPVTAIVYVCPRCPFCAKLVPTLHREATSGRLKGKVKFGAKMFPLRSHANSVPGALAVVGAARLGQQWPFLLGLYERFDQYDSETLPELAGSKGLDPDRMKQLLVDPSVRAELVEMKKEGVRNGVEATPALYVDGRKFDGALDTEQVVDILLEAYERKTGRLCK